MGASSSSSPTVPTAVDPASLSYLAWFDKTLDNVPVVAAANNSVDLALKGLFLVAPQWLIESTTYTKYIDEKRWTKCVGCSFMGFIYTSFFEDPAAATKTEKAEDSAEQKSLLNSSDEAVVTVPDSPELTEKKASAGEAMKRATFEGYTTAIKCYLEAADQVRQQDPERAIGLEKLASEAEELRNQMIERRDREAALLVAQGVDALKSSDPKSIKLAAVHFEHAANIVKESNPKRQLSDWDYVIKQKQLI